MKRMLLLTKEYQDVKPYRMTFFFNLKRSINDQLRTIKITSMNERLAFSMGSINTTFRVSEIGSQLRHKLSPRLKRNFPH